MTHRLGWPTMVMAFGQTLLLATACAQAPSVPTTMPTPTSTPTAAPTETATPLPASPTPIVVALPEGAPFGIETAPGYEVEYILRPAILGPSNLAIGPDGDVFVAEFDGHRIVRVAPDGTVSTHVETERPFMSPVSNPEGELFVTQGDDIIRISADGEQTVFVSEPQAGALAMGFSGDLFVLAGGDIVRFTRDGTRSVFATKVPGGDMAVSPSGEVFLANGRVGKIFKVNRDAVVTTLADTYWHDAFNIAFDRQGNLHSNQDALSRVSLEDGSRSPVSPGILSFFNSRPFAFDRSGDVIFIGPTHNTVIKASLDGKRFHCLVDGVGNSSALAVGPSGELFMGASNCHPISPGKVVRIAPDGGASEFLTGFAFIKDLTFDPDGNMYVSDVDYAGGPSRLLRVAADGRVDTIVSEAGFELHSIAYEPASGDIVAYQENSRRILRITPAGGIDVLPIDFGGPARTVDLAFDQRGNLICLVVFEENYDTGPVHRGLFRVTPDYEVTLLANIDTSLATSEDDVCVGPTGDMFVVGPEEHPLFRMLRITPDGDVSLVARNLPFDTLSCTTNRQGDVFFTCGAGLFRISEK